MGLSNLRESVLAKTREKAKKIKERAEEEASEILRRAEEEYRKRLNKAREEAITKLRNEEYRKYATRVLELNMQLLQHKRRLIKELLDEATKRIRELPSDLREKSLKNLLVDSLNTNVITGKFVGKVVKRDLNILRSVVKDLNLNERLVKTEVLPDEKLGGIIIEDLKGELAIDNTYSTRLERALRVLYEKANKEIFKG